MNNNMKQQNNTMYQRIRSTDYNESLDCLSHKNIQILQVMNTNYTNLLLFEVPLQRKTKLLRKMTYPKRLYLPSWKLSIFPENMNIQLQVKLIANMTQTDAFKLLPTVPKCFRLIQFSKRTKHQPINARNK